MLYGLGSLCTAVPSSLAHIELSSAAHRKLCHAAANQNLKTALEPHGNGSPLRHPNQLVGVPLPPGTELEPVQLPTGREEGLRNRRHSSQKTRAMVLVRQGLAESVPLGGRERPPQKAKRRDAPKKASRRRWDRDEHTESLNHTSGLTHPGRPCGLFDREARRSPMNLNGNQQLRIQSTMGVSLQIPQNEFLLVSLTNKPEGTLNKDVH